MGGKEADEGENIQYHGAVSSQRIPYAERQLRGVRGTQSDINNMVSQATL